MIPKLRSRDPNTLSNTFDWRTLSTDVEVTVSFEKKRVSGVVRYVMERVTEKEEEEDSLGEREEIWLDSSYLDVKSVKVDGKVVTEWEVQERVEPYGGKVVIKVPGKGKVAVGQKVELEIECGTTERCTALQWMEKEQTGNGKWPYMFSQCQAIHARSLFPCQDTPSVKSTYKSTIRSSLPVVVSGIFKGTSDYLPPSDGESHGTLAYHFQQDIPIPSYLYAIASGDLASASIGPRSMVWSGPEELLRNKSELEGEVEKFISVAEKLIFPYEWTTYNVLILPPSFPYGGMENPNMTFATPTIISGDKSNIDVIAHELAHSWSGNLVSNDSWEHFWLNEGWTTYIERRIQGALHGEPHFHFSAIIGWKALKESVAVFGDDHPFTQLVVDLNGKDPDDAFSSIPYEKGFNFLYFLDRTVGREKWDKFIPHYFKTYRRTSLTTSNFKSTLLTFFQSDPDVSNALETKVDWDAWQFSTGLPPKPDFDTTLVDICYALADKWVELNGSPGSTQFRPSPQDISTFTSSQLVAFLEKLLDLPSAPASPPLSQETTQLMDKTYNFTASQNAEILARFFQLGLKSGDTTVYEKAAEWVGTVGRMKFVRPIYRGLVSVDRELAVRTFERFKGWYHPICREAVRKDLGL